MIFFIFTSVLLIIYFPSTFSNFPSALLSKLIKLNLAGLQNLVQTSSDGSLEGHPEAMIVDTAGNEMRIALISDDGTLDYYNDGTQAKDLSHDEFKKFRSDKFVI